MKKLIAISSALAIFVAGSGLFAFDILNGDGEASGFSVNATIQYGFDITTEGNADDATTATGASWVNEIDSDPQSKVNIGVGYDGDNYAFGLGAGWSQGRASVDRDYGGAFLDDAWGKFYFFDKQFWIRAGSLEGPWHHGTDPDDGNWADGDKGLQFNFAPAAVSGLKVGFTLPVPAPDSRTWTEKVHGEEESFVGNWGPAYLIQNAVFGLKLDKTLPGLVFGSELHLKGVDAATEKDSLGVDTRFGVQYTFFEKVTLKAAVKIEDIGAEGEGHLESIVSGLGARLVVALPEVGNLSLGSPWVQVKAVPQEAGNDGKGEQADIARADREAFTQTNIDIEWEPSFKLIPDKLTAIVWTGFYYSIYDDPSTLQEDYPVEFSVRPALKFSFAPNANIQIRDQIYLARKGVENGLKNSLQFRCSLNF
jgi:hypothetical protein